MRSLQDGVKYVYDYGISCFHVLKLYYLNANWSKLHCLVYRVDERISHLAEVTNLNPYITFTF